jgi:putative pre-16S rRNA nuclease
MRYLAIDLGDKRTGLAVGDDETGIASPVGVINTAGADERLRQLGLAIDEQGPDALVLGVPLNMDGSESPGVTKSRAFAKELTERFGLPVHLVDERLTSAAADEQMAQSGLTRGQKKARRDALAAAAILRNFLAGRIDQ